MEYKTPGQLISALLAEKGWTQRVLAIVLGMDETGINKLVADKRSVDAELAIVLEEVFQVPAERFLTLQQNYDLAKARITSVSDPNRANRARLYGDLPVAEMIKRGWITAENVKDPAVESELTRFFGVNRVDDIEILPHAAKKTKVSTEPTAAQLAWLYRVNQIARNMLVARYTPTSAQKAIAQLKPLMSAAEEARKVPRVLAENGIRFLVVEALPSSKIDGVCFWLNDSSPVVALSMRFDRIDNFWFVLRHELEHVVHRHGFGSIMLDTDMESSNDALAEEERVANDAAAEFCVPKKMMDAFIARKNPVFAERDIMAFSKMLGVHAGLVAGQLRYRLRRYD
eukprot:gene20959-21707_t